MKKKKNNNNNNNNKCTCARISITNTTTTTTTNVPVPGFQSLTQQQQQQQQQQMYLCQDFNLDESSDPPSVQTEDAASCSRSTTKINKLTCHERHTVAHHVVYSCATREQLFQFQFSILQCSKHIGRAKRDIQ